MLLDVIRTGLVVNIRRERRLPLRGEVLVNVGQEVRSEDVVAEAHLPEKLFMIDLARGLDIDRMDVQHCLVRQPGEFLLEDDALAQDEGAFPRVVRTPVAGKFVAIHQGQAVLEVAQEKIQVQACLPGVVEAVLPEYGAIVSTAGFLVQGVWGNGWFGEGQLMIIEESWSDPLDKSMVVESENGQVVIAGQCLDKAALISVVEAGYAGLITGTLAPELISTASKVSTMPIVVLQGFGRMPVDRTYLDLFKLYKGELVCLHAAAANRLDGVRPEVIVPQPGDYESVESGVLKEIAIGRRVRVYSGLATGQSGNVLAFVDEPPLFESGFFESGLRFPAVVVELDNGERITVPQQNLVILG